MGDSDDLPPVSDGGVFPEGGTECSDLLGTALQVTDAAGLLRRVVVELERLARIQRKRLQHNGEGNW
jgi:hypothetical protein